MLFSATGEATKRVGLRHRVGSLCVLLGCLVPMRAQSFDLISSRESVLVSLWLPPCVFPQCRSREAGHKRVSQDSSVKTQVRPMKLGASSESAASLQAQSLRYVHVIGYQLGPQSLASGGSAASLQAKSRR